MPIRIFISVGDADLRNLDAMRDAAHDRGEANHRMARALEAKGPEYQYLFLRGARRRGGDGRWGLLAHALERVWNGHASKGAKWAGPGVGS